MNRYQASSIHLLISSTILLLFFGVMRFIWYPDFYFKANGGWAILSIMVAVDVVIGPLLTLLVYKPSKPSLKLDLTIIALVQIVAFIYGGSIIYKERPAYLVYFIDTFEIVTFNELKQLYPDTMSLPDLSGNKIWPQVAYTEMPKDDYRRKLLAKEMLSGAPRIPQRPSYYRPFRERLSAISERSLALSDLRIDEKIDNAALETMIRFNPDSISFLPVYGKTRNIVIAIDNSSGVILGSPSR